jgi:hypothetical protein
MLGILFAVLYLRTFGRVVGFDVSALAGQAIETAQRAGFPTLAATPKGYQA